MIHIIAKVTTVAGKRDKFLEEFRKIVPLVREEEGCIEYGPTVDANSDIAKQSKMGPDTAVIIERWTDLKALKAHLVADHMTDYRQRVKELIEDTVLEIYETA